MTSSKPQKSIHKKHAKRTRSKRAKRTHKKRTCKLQIGGAGTPGIDDFFNGLKSGDFSDNMKKIHILIHILKDGEITISFLEAKRYTEIITCLQSIGWIENAEGFLKAPPGDNSEFISEIESEIEGHMEEYSDSVLEESLSDVQSFYDKQLSTIQKGIQDMELDLNERKPPKKKGKGGKKKSKSPTKNSKSPTKNSQSRTKNSQSRTKESKSQMEEYPTGGAMDMKAVRSRSKKKSKVSDIQVGMKMIALQETQVRRGLDLNSDSLGRLHENDDFIVIQVIETSDGRLRVQIDQVQRGEATLPNFNEGWVSHKTSRGKTLIQPIWPIRIQDMPIEVEDKSREIEIKGTIETRDYQGKRKMKNFLIAAKRTDDDHRLLISWVGERWNDSSITVEIISEMVLIQYLNDKTGPVAVEYSFVLENKSDGIANDLQAILRPPTKQDIREFTGTIERIAEDR